MFIHKVKKLKKISAKPTKMEWVVIVGIIFIIIILILSTWFITDSKPKKPKISESYQAEYLALSEFKRYANDGVSPSSGVVTTEVSEFNSELESLLYVEKSYIFLDAWFVILNLKEKPFSPLFYARDPNSNWIRFSRDDICSDGKPCYYYHFPVSVKVYSKDKIIVFP